jgi:hypothetical protein
MGWFHFYIKYKNCLFRSCGGLYVFWQVRDENMLPQRGVWISHFWDLFNKRAVVVTGSDSQESYTAPWLYSGCVVSWCPIVIPLLPVGMMRDPHIPPWRGNPCCPPSSAPSSDVRLEAARSSVPTFGHSSSLLSARNHFLLDPWLYTRTGNVETWWTGGK